MRILLRADSGFAREALMAWCEANKVDYLFGLARNSRLVEQIHIELAWAEDEAERTGKPARRFADFRWATRDSWRQAPAGRGQRPSGWPDRGEAGANPRFRRHLARRDGGPGQDALRAPVLCTRRHGEPDQGVPARPVRRPAPAPATMKANQLRLWFASMAYVLLAALRRIALAHTQLEKATCGSLRLKLLKIGAQVTVTLPPHPRRHGLGLSPRRGVRPRARPIVPLIRASRAPPPARQTTLDPHRPGTRQIRRNGHACPDLRPVSPPPSRTPSRTGNRTLVRYAG